MAQRITAFQAADGTLFTSAAECATYEKTSLLGAAVSAALGALGLVGARVTSDTGNLDLKQFLIDNSELLVESLSTAPVKAPRKPREPKAPAEDEAAAKLIAAGVGAGVGSTDIPPIVIKAEETPAPEVKVEVPDAEAGKAAEDELAALLGGDEVSL